MLNDNVIFLRYKDTCIVKFSGSFCSYHKIPLGGGRLLGLVCCWIGGPITTASNTKTKETIVAPHSSSVSKTAGKGGKSVSSTSVATKAISSTGTDGGRKKQSTGEQTVIF